jgi:hypothetical protein
VPATSTELRTYLEATTLPPALAGELLDTVPALWLSSDEPGVLARDLALCHPSLGPNEIRAVAAPKYAGDGWRLTVVAHDRPGRLADTTAVLAAAGLSIAAASAATWPHLGLALHAVIVEGPTLPGEVMDELGRQLRVGETGASLTTRFVPKGRASVQITGDAGGVWVVAVRAPDQPGLLWAVCRWLADQGASIQAAWVATADEQADDLFVVTGAPDLSGLAQHLSAPAQDLPARAVELLARVGRLISRRS